MITLTETEKRIVEKLDHPIVTVAFLEEWLNPNEPNYDGSNPYGANFAAMSQGYYAAVQRMADLFGPTFPSCT